MARGLLRIVAAMIAPCSVKTYGNYLRCWPRPVFKVAICDLKDLVSSTYGAYLRCWPPLVFKVAIRDLKELVSAVS
jgi:hypothetical protein